MGNLRNIISVIGLFVFSASLSWFAVEKFSVLGMMERWIADVRVATLTPHEPKHPEIIIVTFNEDTLRQFPYRSPIDREFLANLLQQLSDKGVRAVLLDVLLDQPTEPEKDQKLKAILTDYKPVLAVSYIDSSNLLTAEQQNFLHDFLPKNIMGLANLGKDQFDNTVREIYPGKVTADGSYLPGVASLIATKLGKPQLHEATQIAWRGAPENDADSGAFRVFPAHMVKFLPADWFTDKIVLIGSDLSLRDRHRTPFSVNARNQEGLKQFGMPGVFILAHTLGQMLENRASPALSSTKTVLLLTFFALLGTYLAWMHLILWARLLILVFILPAFWFFGFYTFQNGGPLIPLIMPSLGLLFAFIFSEIYRGWDDRKKRNFLKQAFSRYLSPELVELLVKDPDRLARGAERRELTFLFTDIEGFTTVSEQADPAELAPQMNHYLDGVCSTILRHGGMVVDLIGDAVFAMFNAPLDQEDHARRAILCSLEINKVAKEFQQTPEARRLGFGRTRIGINTGEALVGNFGAEDRFKYTPLGDAVNIGARIEGLNKYFGTQICASGKSVESSNVDNVRPIGDVILKGKKEPITIFEVIPDDMEDAAYLKQYLAAFHLLEKEKTAEATAAFSKLQSSRPDDGCVAFHLERLKNDKGSVKIKMTDK